MRKGQYKNSCCCAVPCNTSCDSRPPLFVFFFVAEMPEDVQERAGRHLSVRRAKPAPSAAAAPSTAGRPFTHGACRGRGLAQLLFEPQLRLFGPQLFGS